MLELTIWRYRIAHLLSTIWDIAWKGSLRLLFGKNFRRTVNIIGINKVLRLGIRLFYIRRIGENIVQTVFPDGIMLQPVDNMGHIIWEIYLAQAYDKLYSYQSDDVIIDIGAHVGLFTLKIARNAKKGLIIAVEPHPFNYELLVRNMEFNKIRNVIPLNLALADFNGITTLYLAEESGMHSVAIRRSDKYLRVQAKTLDQLVDELKLNKVDFIKIDVEGYAFTVLKGAERTLKNNDLFIVASCGHTPQEFRNVYRYLSDKGFEIKVGSRKDIYASNARMQKQLNNKIIDEV